jgi:lysophospholipase L1-like esterase
VGVLVAGLLAARGRWWGAIALVALLVGIAQARKLSPGFDHRFAAGVGRFATGLGHVVSGILLGAVFVLVFLPVAAFRRIVGRSSLGRPRGLPSRGWIPHDVLGPSPSRRGFGSEPGRVRAARPPLVVRVAGVVAAVVLLDLVIGAGLTAAGRLPPSDRGDVLADIEEATSTLMQEPPVADEPWAAEFGRDLAAFQLAGRGYVPYLVNGYGPFESRYLNTTASERISYRQPEGDGEPLQVGFFGGSVMFGVGQRDEHTIPSEFARLAEEAGVDVEVHNYGFPGWVAWQEAQLLERRLAGGEDLDLVVFLDGFNELHLQDLGYSPDPTHIGIDVLQGFVDDFTDNRQRPVGYLDGLHDLADAYARNSAVLRLVSSFGPEDPPPQIPAGPESAEERAEAALDVYARSIRLAADVAGDHDVPTAFFWQPRRAGWPAEITDRLDDDVVDVTHVFDGREDDLYLDDVHTDEVGARLLAEAIWDELEPQLAPGRG